MKLRPLAEMVSPHGGSIQTGPFGSQLHQSDYTDEGVPVVMPKDIEGGRIDQSSVARIPQNKADALARHRLFAGDIVFPRRGEIRKCALVRPDDNGFLCGTGCLKISVPRDILSPEFLHYYLHLPGTGGWLEQHAVGTTMLNLNTSILGALPVPEVGLARQCRIADILAAYDDLIENNRRRIKLLEEAARLIYREWFVRLRFPGHEHTKLVDGVPEGWRRVPLGDLCFDVRDQVAPAQLDAGVPYVGLEHIPRRSITLADWGTAEDVSSTKFRFAARDVLFARIRPYFHKVGFALVDGITSSDAIVIRPRDGTAWAYMLLLLSSDEFVALASKTVREGSKMPRADWKFLVRQSVTRPPAAMVADLASIIDPICAQLRTLASQNRRLTRSRDLLLPRLMSGEVEV